MNSSVCLLLGFYYHCINKLHIFDDITVSSVAIFEFCVALHLSDKYNNNLRKYN